jgi:hypothetical protein
LCAGTASGIVTYATDAAVTKAVYALDGALHTVDLLTGEITTLGASGSDPRLDPAGRHVAHVSDGALHVDGRPVLTPDGPEVTWGLPEHVAAESMARHRGYWWAPDGTRLLVARMDNAQVSKWHLSEPASPGRPPTVMAYPAAGTDNADVTLWLTTPAGKRTEVIQDGLMVGDDLVTPPGLQVLRILAVDGDTVLAQCCDEPTERHLYRYSRAEGLVRITSEPGVHTGTRGGGVTLVVTRTLDEHGVRVTVTDERAVTRIASNSAAAVRFPDLDLGRVAIRGWSYGGYLAAAAVLRRLPHRYRGRPGHPDLASGVLGNPVRQVQLPRGADVEAPRPLTRPVRAAGGHARCDAVARASRFLTGLVICFATHGGIPAVVRAARRR